MNVRRVSIQGLDAATPFQMDATNASEVVITDSTFESVHWPGFDFTNVSRIVVKGNAFLDIASNSFSARGGKKI